MVTDCSGLHKLNQSVTGCEWNVHSYIGYADAALIKFTLYLLLGNTSVFIEIKALCWIQKKQLHETIIAMIFDEIKSWSNRYVINLSTHGRYECNSIVWILISFDNMNWHIIIISFWLLMTIASLARLMNFHWMDIENGLCNGLVCRQALRNYLS